MSNRYRQPMSSQLRWGYVERVKCKTCMSQGLPRQNREGGRQIKGNNFLPLFSPGEAALGYRVQFWCPQAKRDVEEPELLTHRESSGPTRRAGWAQPGWRRRRRGICSHPAATCRAATKVVEPNSSQQCQATQGGAAATDGSLGASGWIREHSFTSEVVQPWHRTAERL